MQFPTTATFLELGYGSGSWLLSMSQRGYTHLWGYDIEANAEGKQRLEDRGVTVSSGLFLENDYPQEYFDCIRLEHVFEHLAAPQAVLEKCHRLLKPGGALVLSLPSKGSWSFALEPRYCASLDVPRHLFHHTEASVALMLDRAGFSGVVAKSYPVIMVLGASINNQLGDKNLPKVPVMFFQLLGPIYRAFAYIAGRGEFMTVLAYK
ncbi:MAG TPA: class I SAM-dependent methyltransferase [Bryobacteraceae bacterium]|nr:class I SAM-dependent methyltransferase [Bryobacteraceae bacterium]